MAKQSVQAPLGIDDFVDYHAGYLQRFTGGDMAKARDNASIRLAEIFQTVNPLAKSLSATGIVAQGGTTGADALKIEDVIDEVQSTELSSEDYAPAWKWVTKKPCRSDVVQLTNMSDYGGSDDLGFVDETATDGGLDPLDPAFDRKVARVKWLGQHGQVMRTALVVEAMGMGGDAEIGNAMELASFARLERLLKTANYHLWHGNSTKNVHEFDGFLKQISDAGTAAKPTEINLGGLPLTGDTLIDCETALFDNGGRFTDLWAGMKTWQGLKRDLQSAVRIGSGQDINLGNNPAGYMLQKFGLDPELVKFHRDKHLDASVKDGTQSAAPGAPTAPATVTLAPSGTAAINKWGSYLAPSGGTFYYAVSAVSSRGESISTAAGSSQAVTSTQKVTITIARGSADTQFYYIYRGTSAGVLQKLDRVLCAGASTTYDDKGDIIPGCANAAALSNTKITKGFTTVMFRQLWAVDKIKLPPAVMSEQFAWLLAGTPQVTKAVFNVIFRNVGVG